MLSPLCFINFSLNSCKVSEFLEFHGLGDFRWIDSLSVLELNVYSTITTNSQKVIKSML